MREPLLYPSATKPPHSHMPAASLSGLQFRQKNSQPITKNSFHEITSPMDPLTHALASYTLKSAAFPPAFSRRHDCRARCRDQRRHRLAEANLPAHMRSSLSIVRTVILLSLALLLSLLITLSFLLPQTWTNGTTNVSLPSSSQLSPAAFLHLAMDVCQSTGIELLWPLSARRFLSRLGRPHRSLDFGDSSCRNSSPALSRLVTEEIGAKSKGPRGKVGASLALAAMILYVVLRFVLHSNALATMESRTYRGELPRKTAAFPESGSPFRWHGIVETERALHDLEIDVGPGASFDPDAAISSYKPEPSPALDAARDTAAAGRFSRWHVSQKPPSRRLPGDFTSPARLSILTRC